MSNVRVRVECGIIRDLLPSYADGLTSEVSNEIIEEHLAVCEDCRAALDKMLSGESERAERIRKEEKAYLRYVNRKRKRPLILGVLSIALSLILIYLFVPGVIGDVSINREQKASITEQYESRHELYYEDYFPDRWFADIKIYGIERKNKGRLLVYADVSDAEYVRLNGKAYDVGGSSGCRVLHVKTDGDELKLDGVVVPEDGEMHNESLRKLFPMRYYIRMMLAGGDGGNYRGDKIKKRVTEVWNVEASDDMMVIDEEEGTYRIYQDDDNYDAAPIEEGRLP